MGAAAAQSNQPLRWGVVGTGVIAGQLAPMIRLASSSELVAVCSRTMDRARSFARVHEIERAFDSWEELVAWDGVDAVYVATPTGTRETLCTAAAESGKHVLGEKPFASLESVQRITTACRDHGVGFMDGTHFVHHPRTARIKSDIPERVGSVISIASAFQIKLSDSGNIRLDPELEPMGAIGDLGWYNVRAALEFMSPGVEIVSTAAHVRRHPTTGAAVGASASIGFDDGAATAWNCGFDFGALVMDLRISGPGGSISLDDFVGNRADRPARYRCQTGGFGQQGTSEEIEVPAAKPAAALMFEDFAAMVREPGLIEASIAVTERNQAWLDRVWQAAMDS